MSQKKDVPRERWAGEARLVKMVVESAALRAQVEELKRERDRQRGAAEKHYALAEERLVLLNHAEERAERAEARLAKVVEALADVVEDSKDGLINRGLNSIQNAEAALAAARGDDAEPKTWGYDTEHGERGDPE